MPSFCTSCGAPLTGPFCVKCGQRAQAPSAPRPPQSAAQPTMQPAAPPGQAAPKSSGFGKALLLIGGIVFLMFLMGLAATFYGVYRVKRRIATYTGPSSSDQVNATQGNSCALLSREDLQQVLGVTIEKTTEMTEGSDPGCAYYTNPAAFTQLQRMAIEEARKEPAQATASCSIVKTLPKRSLRNKWRRVFDIKVVLRHTNARRHVEAASEFISVGTSL